MNRYSKVFKNIGIFLSINSKAINNAIKAYSELEEFKSRIALLCNKQDTDKYVIKLLKYASREYSKTVFNFPGVAIIAEKLYMQLSSGLDIEEAYKKVKKDVDKEILEKNMEYRGKADPLWIYLKE